MFNVRRRTSTLKSAGTPKKKTCGRRNWLLRNRFGELRWRECELIWKLLKTVNASTRRRFGFQWAREAPESNDLIKGSELWTNSLIQAFLNELDHSIERGLHILNKTSYFGHSQSTILVSLPLSAHPVGFHQFSKVYVGFSLPSGLFNLV